MSLLGRLWGLTVCRAFSLGPDNVILEGATDQYLLTASEFLPRQKMLAISLI